MDKKRLGISGWGSISAAGAKIADRLRHYASAQHLLGRVDSGDWAGKVTPDIEEAILTLRQSDRSLAPIDRTALLSILAAKAACEQANWYTPMDMGIQIGSSRGATELWENFHQHFLEDSNTGLSPLSSPLTTLGNIASWTAYYLKSGNPLISHSITCSTALHALLNAVVWLESGRITRFLVGGAEAPITPFSIAQMMALRLYARPDELEYPCQAMQLTKKNNTMILGEGAACFCIEMDPLQPLAWIAGIGYGTEWGGSAAGISFDGEGIQFAMRMALQEADLETVDAIVTHSPGTQRGDLAEWRAIDAVFGGSIPLLTNNKWKIGHTLGASGGLSLDLALLMLQEGVFFPVPYFLQRKQAEKITSVMVNAMGFGGNAISVIVTGA
jgi:3-oxoacyl-(acyl-carrier-protein) synthase